ncbi:MAG: TatD family hydrolase [Bacilli bacterium]|jgi:TatD DNase family protein|nr:TatD family hydrolase [Bacilli bacterium]
MNFFDSHCHLFREYYSSLEEVFQNAKAASVGRYIVSGCNHQSNREVMTLLSNASCYGVIGIHPEEASENQEKALIYLEEHIQDTKILGIGEIGLDYHYTKENKELQKELFEAQLRIAEKYHVPVIIHSREATADTIEILKRYQVKGIIHSFTGSLETAKIYIEMGYKLGINGVVTFKNSHLKEILPFIFPSIVLETDSPYLTPHPYRGQQNQPKNIYLIASFIAETLKIDISQVEKVTNDNLYAIFDKLS